jgi:hypothetical protein
MLMESCGGDCVSIYMPTHRAGSEIQQGRIRLKNLLSQAEDLLTERGLRKPEIDEVLGPARMMTKYHEFWIHQSDGLAAFLSGGDFHYYRVPLEFQELVVVSDRFHLKPLIPLITEDGRFYILALSQNEIRLLEGTRCSINEVEIEGIPPSLEDALRWDDPEKSLQWHSKTTSVGRGRRPAIFHGHGASADDPKDYFRRYFLKIDEGLAELLSEERAPLVLAGVDYELAIYRDVTSYPYVLERDLKGNPEMLSAAELHEQAWSIVEPCFVAARREAMAQYAVMVERDLASDKIEEVVPAAFNGRVDKAFVALQTQQWGAFDPQSNTVHLTGEVGSGGEDLLDFVAVHTLLNGGAVYTVERDEVPGEGPVAAIFRY